MRSPIFYPGSKRYAVKQIRAHFPLGLTEMVSPFFGGGSVELACAADGIRVHGYDAFEPLVNFWQVALEHPGRLGERAKRLMPLSRGEFHELRNSFGLLDDVVEQAATYFVLNRYGFAGQVFTGGFGGEWADGKKRVTRESEGGRVADRMPEVAALPLAVLCSDFERSLGEHPDMFAFLDPPYFRLGQGFYRNGEVGFDHETLSNLLRGRSGWIASYDDCPEVREMYRGHEFVSAGWRYRTSGNKNVASEVLILSRDLSVIE